MRTITQGTFSLSEFIYIETSSGEWQESMDLSKTHVQHQLAHWTITDTGSLTAKTGDNPTQRVRMLRPKSTLRWRRINTGPTETSKRRQRKLEQCAETAKRNGSVRKRDFSLCQCCSADWEDTGCATAGCGCKYVNNLSRNGKLINPCGGIPGMSAALGFQRGDRDREREREWAPIQDKKAPLSPFMTGPTTAPAYTLHPILYSSVLGIPCSLCLDWVYRGQPQGDRIVSIHEASHP